MKNALSVEHVGTDAVAFGIGMYALAENFGKQIGQRTIDVFWEQLHAEMTTAEWQAVVTRTIRASEGKSWATVGDLLKTLRTLRAEAAEDEGDRPSPAELERLQREADAEAERERSRS